MKPETEGKALVAIIISLIAFGFGSGAGIVMGFYQNDSSIPQVNNSTKEIPQIPSTNNANVNTEPKTNANITNEEVYTEPISNDSESSNNTTA